MTGNHLNLDLVNINAYTKFGEILSILYKDIKWKQKSDIKKGHNSGTIVQKIICNNSKQDLVNMNPYIKFGEILSICSQDIIRKRNFGVNQGP